MPPISIIRHVSSAIRSNGRSGLGLPSTVITKLSATNACIARDAISFQNPKTSFIPSPHVFNSITTDTRLNTWLGTSRALHTVRTNVANTNEHAITSLTLDKADDLSAAMKAFPRLESLAIRDGKGLTDEHVKQIAQFTKLTSLDLRAWNITDAGIAHLAKLPLTHVRIESQHLTDTGLAHLKDLPLTSLSIWSPHVTDAALAAIAHHQLTHLALWSRHITDAGVAHIADMLLTHLDLGSMNITNAGLRHIQGMPITHLSLKGFGITKDGLVNLKGMPLTHLDLVGTRISAVDRQLVRQVLVGCTVLP